MNILRISLSLFAHKISSPTPPKRPSTSADGPRSLPRRGLKSRLLQFASNYGFVFPYLSTLWIRVRHAHSFRSIRFDHSVFVCVYVCVFLCRWTRWLHTHHKTAVSPLSDIMLWGESTIGLIDWRSTGNTHIQRVHKTQIEPNQHQFYEHIVANPLLPFLISDAKVSEPIARFFACYWVHLIRLQQQKLCHTSRFASFVCVVNCQRTVRPEHWGLFLFKTRSTSHRKPNLVAAPSIQIQLINWTKIKLININTICFTFMLTQCMNTHITLLTALPTECSEILCE